MLRCYMLNVDCMFRLTMSDDRSVLEILEPLVLPWVVFVKSSVVVTEDESYKIHYSAMVTEVGIDNGQIPPSSPLYRNMLAQE